MPANKDFKRLVRALDYAGAHAWPHRRIAEYVHEKFKVGDWWAQTVTVRSATFWQERLNALGEVL